MKDKKMERKNKRKALLNKVNSRKMKWDLTIMIVLLLIGISVGFLAANYFAIGQRVTYVVVNNPDTADDYDFQLVSEEYDPEEGEEPMLLADRDDKPIIGKFRCDEVKTGICIIHLNRTQLASSFH